MCSFRWKRAPDNGEQASELPERPCRVQAASDSSLTPSERNTLLQITPEQENECWETSSSTDLGLAGSHCLSGSKRNRETLEVSAIPVFSRPPSVPRHALKLPPAMGHGPWAYQIHSPEAMPNSLLEKAPGWFSPERQSLPPCYCLGIFTDTNSAPSILTDNNKGLTFSGVCFVCLFTCCPEFLAAVQRKGPSFLRKEGLGLGTGGRESQGHSLMLLVRSLPWQSPHWER